MRILFLSQWFQPEPFFKGLPFAKALLGLGHEVEVVTGFPNYPGGRVYPGYKVRVFQREILDGIRVNRVALHPSHDSSGFRRTLNYLSFGMAAALLSPLVVRRPDAVYVYNLVTLGPAAQALRLTWRCPVVYDIQDLWPDSVADSGMMNNPLLLRILDRWCRTVYRSASHLVTLSQGMKAELVRRSVPEDRISVIYNWCDEDSMRFEEPDPSLRIRLGLAGSFVVMFAGTMGLMQGLDTVLEAAERVREVEPRIRFVFVGGGVDRERLRHIASERGLHNVTFLERQPPEAMGKILAISDLMLVHLKDTPIFRITIPSKIQAYMAAAKPILCAVRGDAAELVRVAGAGISAEPENPMSIARSVLQLFSLSDAERKSMGANAREYYTRMMSMDAGYRRFDELFRACCC